jgi:hypothetical protein
VRWSSVVVVILALTGCGGAQEPDEQAPVERLELIRAFAAADEPLVVRLDLSSDPESPLDVILVPEREDVPEPPFEVNVFKSFEAAEHQARSIAMVAEEGTAFVRWKNVILTLAPPLPGERKQRLIDVLRSL